VHPLKLLGFLGVLSIGTSLAIAAPAAKPVVHPAIARDGWPESDLGRLARQWTQAFSKGEAAMREALPRIMSSESLAKRTMESRLESYRAMHERFGALMLVSVDSTGAGALKVTLAASDMSEYQFTFVAHAGPPVRLGGITLFDRRSGSHGGGYRH